MTAPLTALNLYAGIGGNRRLWPSTLRVTAVERCPQVAAIYARHFPQDEIIVADAHAYLIAHMQQFSFIWSSPPCQTHTCMAVSGNGNRTAKRYPDLRLYEEIIALKQWAPCKWIVENVNPWYPPLITPRRLGRHLYWSNFYITDCPEPPGNPGALAGTNTTAAAEDLARWLGFPYIPVYLDGSKTPSQAYRNCVHPVIGRHILDAAFGIAPHVTSPLFPPLAVSPQSGYSEILP